MRDNKSIYKSDMLWQNGKKLDSETQDYEFDSLFLYKNRIGVYYLCFHNNDFVRTEFTI